MQHLLLLGQVLAVLAHVDVAQHVVLLLGPSVLLARVDEVRGLVDRHLEAAAQRRREDIVALAHRLADALLAHGRDPELRARRVRGRGMIVIGRLIE